MRVTNRELRRRIRKILKESKGQAASTKIDRKDYIVLCDAGLWNKLTDHLIAGVDSQSTAFGQTFENVCYSVFPDLNLQDLNTTTNMPFADALGDLVTTAGNPTGGKILYSMKFSRSIDVGTLGGARYDLLHQAVENAQNHPDVSGKYIPFGLIKGDYSVELDLKRFLNVGALPIKISFITPNLGTQRAVPRFGFDSSTNYMAFKVLDTKKSQGDAAKLANNIFGKGNWEKTLSGPLFPKEATYKLASGKTAEPSKSSVTTPEKFNEDLMLGNGRKSSDIFLLLNPFDDANEFVDAYNNYTANDEVPAALNKHRQKIQYLYDSAVKAQSRGKIVPAESRVTGVFLSFEQFFEDCQKQVTATQSFKSVVDDNDKMQKYADKSNTVDITKQSGCFIVEVDKDGDPKKYMYYASNAILPSTSSQDKEPKAVKIKYPGGPIRKAHKPDQGQAQWAVTDYANALVSIYDAFSKELNKFVVNTGETIPWAEYGVPANIVQEFRRLLINRGTWIQTRTGLQVSITQQNTAGVKEANAKIKKRNEELRALYNKYFEESNLSLSLDSAGQQRAKEKAEALPGTKGFREEDDPTLLEYKGDATNISTDQDDIVQIMRSFSSPYEPKENDIPELVVDVSSESDPLVDALVDVFFSAASYYDNILELAKIDMNIAIQQLNLEEMNESRIYENILKKILYTAKKRR